MSRRNGAAPGAPDPGATRRNAAGGVYCNSATTATREASRRVRAVVRMLDRQDIDVAAVEFALHLLGTAHRLLGEAAA